MITALLQHIGTAKPVFTSREHAWDTRPVEVSRDALPLLYAYMGDESVANDGTDLTVSHRLGVTVHIYIVCKIEDLEARKDDLRTAVIGWNPGAADGWDDMHLSSGKVLDLKGGIVWWEDIYTSWRTLRQAYS